MRSVLSDNPQVIGAAIVDDTAYVGKPAHVASAGADFNVRMEDTLRVRMAHKQAYKPGGFSDAEAVLLQNAGYATEESGLTFAGTPIGEDSYLQQHVRERADEVIKLINLAGEMVALDQKGTALQGVFRWLRLSVLPKFNFVLQVVEPRITIPHARRIDKAAESMCIQLAGGEKALLKMTEEEIERVRARIHLPVKDGGMGLGSQELQAPGAYIGTWAATLSTIAGREESGGLGIVLPPLVAGMPQDYPEWTRPYKEALSLLKTPLGDALTKRLTLEKIMGEPTLGIQSAISAITSKAALAKLEEAVNHAPDTKSGQVERDRTEAATTGEGGAWLTAPPSDKECVMDNHSFSAAMRYRLCLPQDVGEGQACAQCGKCMDRLGNHAILCTKLAGHRAQRAALQQRLLRTCCSKAGLRPFPGEPVVTDYLQPKPGGDDEAPLPVRRADVLIPTGHNNIGNAYKAVDLTIAATTNSSARTYKAGDAAARAEKGKENFYNRTYMPKANGPICTVVPFAQEDGGPLGKQAKELLKELAESIPAVGPYGQNHPSHRYRRLVERFSVFMQRWRASVEVQFLRLCANPQAHVVPDSDAEPAEEEADGEGPDDAPAGEQE